MCNLFTSMCVSLQFLEGCGWDSFCKNLVNELVESELILWLALKKNFRPFPSPFVKKPCYLDHLKFYLFYRNFLSAWEHSTGSGRWGAETELGASQVCKGIVVGLQLPKVVVLYALCYELKLVGKVEVRAFDDSIMLQWLLIILMGYLFIIFTKNTVSERMFQAKQDVACYN